MKAVRSTFDAADVVIKSAEASAEAPPDQQIEIALNAQCSLIPPVVSTYWYACLLDITATIHEVCEIVMFDQSVSQEQRIERANALKLLGETFSHVPEWSDEKDAKKESGEGEDKRNNDALMEMEDKKLLNKSFFDAALEAQLAIIRAREDETFKAVFGESAPVLSEGEKQKMND